MIYETAIISFVFRFLFFFSFLDLVPLQNKLVFPAEGHSVNSAGDRGRGEVRERNEEMGKTREGKGVWVGVWVVWLWMERRVGKWIQSL